MDLKKIRKFFKFHDVQFQDIAKDAGVTPSAVSLFFAGTRNSTRIKEAIKKRVNQIKESGEPIYFDVEV